MSTRFKTRTFLLCSVPFAALLAASFWMVQSLVQSTVHDSVRASLMENQLAISRIHAKSELQNSRFLRVAGENSALKAGVQLLLSHPGNAAARRTVEDQLRELGEHMGFDFLLVSGPTGSPLAGVVRQTHGADTQLVPMNPTVLSTVKAGLVPLDGQIFQVASTPVDENVENIGALAVGEYFDFSEFSTHAVLLHSGRVIQSNIPDISLSILNDAFAGCNQQTECDVRLRGERWISLAVHSYGQGYLLRSLENVDNATAPLQSRLHRLFSTLALITVLTALFTSLAVSRSIEKPLAAIVSHLRNAARTGALPEFSGPPSSVLEIRELAETYNRAAISVREAGEKLGVAYLEFIGTLASALDARDPYTAGHSWRVSQLSYAIGAAIHLPEADLERIRIGSLLHDIGKIGIDDTVLRKRGRLTETEVEMVRQHPVIGRRILEGVRGFAPFLAAVELHHENWDGSGYPWGQSEEETPIDARIIHVADAYDAMTSDRSYRKGMCHDRALEELVRHAGTQFDPRIVEAFLRLPREAFQFRSAVISREYRVMELAG